jgi:hypothetical protein
MKEMITMCGYRCDLCPAFASTITCEEDARRACDGFKACYGFELAPENVTCDGCRSDGRCIDVDCPVRPCVKEKGFWSCAECDSFDACDKLKARMDFLEPLPEKLAALPPEDFKRFVVPYQARLRMLALRAEFLKSREK